MTREEAKKELSKMIFELGFEDNVDDKVYALNMAIQALSQEPKSWKWIPVSERLPEDRDWYLGIFKEPDTEWINHLPFICDYVGTKTKFTTEDFWIIRCGSDREDGSGDYYKSLRCVAWMPLPKPYTAESEE